MVQVGIASFYVENKCETLDPTVVQRTFEYTDWIKSISGEFGDDGSSGSADMKLITSCSAILIAILIILLG